VVDFATDARAWRDELAAASDEHKAGAQAYVRGLVARGGTAIDDALGRALKFRAARDATRPLSVVFLTDGQPTIGETEPDRIVENLKKAPAIADARVFVWGVGGDLNTHLLDRIALDHRGERYYVLPGEDVEVAMSNFYDTIASPVLTDLELTFEGAVRVNDVYPRRLGDLFQGHQLVVVGRFTGEGHAAVRLKGKLMGQPKEFVYEGKFERHEQNAHVPVLWARRKIGFLLDEIRLRGESQEVKDEVIRLARRHGLPTPYTSYLVLEEGAQANRGAPRPPGQPVPPSAPAEDAAADAFGRLAREAEAERRANGPQGGGARDEGFAQAPSAAPSGEDAVRLAQSASRMRSGDKAEQDDVAGVSREVIEQSIRSVGDRTFYRHGEVWVESTIGARTPESKWKTIALWSDEHFALLRERPELGQFMALGKVIFKAGDTTYELK
jgi:Ca-activated chloride channel family protein